MSIPRPQRTDWTPQSSALPPYRRGERVCAVGPDGLSYLLRVERVIPTPAEDFTLVAAVVAPRRLRGHLITTPVDVNGIGPAIRAAPGHQARRG